MKVFKYGLLAPTMNSDLVRIEMQKAHNYQNEFINIECWFRDEVRKIEQSVGNIQQFEIEYQQKLDEYTAIDKEIKIINSKAREKAANKDLLDKRKCVNKEKKSALNILQAARKKLRAAPEIILAKKKLIKERNNKENIVRGNKDISPWWGTYSLIEKSVKQIKKVPYYNGLNPNNPRLQSIKSSQRIGVGQFQPHELVANILDGTSKYIQIVQIPNATKKKNGQTRRIGWKNLKLLRVRIQSDEKGNPIWAEFPMVYHRPLEGSVAVVQIIKRKIGPRECWTVSITCSGVDIKKTICQNNSEIVAIDLGWREYDDRIVVATWQSTDNKEGEIAINKNYHDINKLNKYGLYKRLQYINDLKSIRDKNFNQIKILLSNYINDNSSIIPNWLKEETNTISKWKSKARLNNLIQKWKNNRFAGDEIIIGTKGYWNKLNHIVVDGNGLLGWQYHDFHLWNLETSISRKTRNALREFYKLEAIKLSSQYNTIVFEDINGSNLAKGKAGSKNRQLTSPFEFRSICKMIFSGKDYVYFEENAKNSSMECNYCGYINEKTSALEYFCSNIDCKKEIHRDKNAAKNLLTRYLERLTKNASGSIISKPSQPLATQKCFNFNDLNNGTNFANICMKGEVSLSARNPCYNFLNI